MDDLFIFIIIVSIFFLIMFTLNGKIVDKDVIKVKSSLDDKVYIVRDLPNSQDAANKLAELKQKILKFVSHMKTNYSDEPGVKRMLNNLIGSYQKLNKPQRVNELKELRDLLV